MQNKKARASSKLKKKIKEASCEQIGVIDFYEDERIVCIRKEIMEVERYFLKKIASYKLDFECEKAALEKDLEGTKISHLNVLLKLKETKQRITELEAKNMFYKNKLRKFEEENNKN